MAGQASPERCSRSGLLPAEGRHRIVGHPGEDDRRQGQQTRQDPKMQWRPARFPLRHRHGGTHSIFSIESQPEGSGPHCFRRKQMGIPFPLVPAGLHGGHEPERSFRQRVLAMNHAVKVLMSQFVIPRCEATYHRLIAPQYPVLSRLCGRQEVTEVRLPYRGEQRQGQGGAGDFGHHPDRGFVPLGGGAPRDRSKCAGLPRSSQRFHATYSRNNAAPGACARGSASGARSGK
jgi:hypothetical protein